MRTRKLESFMCFAAACVGARNLCSYQQPDTRPNTRTHKHCKTLATTSTVQQIAFEPRRSRERFAGAEHRGPSVRFRIKPVLQKVEFPANAPDNDSPASKGSSLAYTNGTKHIVVSTTCKHPDGRHSQTQMAQNKLCLAPWHPRKHLESLLANTYIATKQKHHGLPQTPR